MKVIAVIQARMGSSRLPGKVLMPVNETESVLSYLVKRLKLAKLIDQIIIATSINDENDLIEDFCSQKNLECFRGSEKDVLDRFYMAVKDLAKPSDYIIRITADCPLLDPKIVDSLIKFTISNSLDFCNNSMKPSFPDGMDVAAIRFETLENAWKNASQEFEREHVTPYIINHSNFRNGTLFKSDCYSQKNNHSLYRLTLDEEEDFFLIKELIKNHSLTATADDYVNHLKSNPDLFEINSHFKRNSKYIEN